MSAEEFNKCFENILCICIGNVWVILQQEIAYRHQSRYIDRHLRNPPVNKPFSIIVLLWGKTIIYLSVGK